MAIKCSGVTARVVMSRISDTFPGAGRDRVAAFIEFDVVDEGLDRFAFQTAFFDTLREEVTAFVAPAELGHETVPHVTLLIAARRPVSVRPCEHGFVAVAGQRVFPDRRIGNAEETTATAVEGGRIAFSQI